MPARPRHRIQRPDANEMTSDETINKSDSELESRLTPSLASSLSTAQLAVVHPFAQSFVVGEQESSSFAISPATAAAATAFATTPSATPTNGKLVSRSRSHQYHSHNPPPARGREGSKRHLQQDRKMEWTNQRHYSQEEVGSRNNAACHPYHGQQRSMKSRAEHQHQQHYGSSHRENHHQRARNTDPDKDYYCSSHHRHYNRYCNCVGSPQQQQYKRKHTSRDDLGFRPASAYSAVSASSGHGGVVGDAAPPAREDTRPRVTTTTTFTFDTSSQSVASTTTATFRKDNVIDLCVYSSSEEDCDDSHRQLPQQRGPPLPSSSRGGQLNHRDFGNGQDASTSACSSGLGGPAAAASAAFASSSATRRMEPPSSEEQPPARGARGHQRVGDNLPSSSPSSSFVGLRSQHPTLQDEMSSASNLIALVGSEPRQREESTHQILWACPSCTLDNPQHFVQCGACRRTNPSLTNKAVQRGVEGGVATGNPSQQPAGWGRHRTFVPSLRVGASGGHQNRPFEYGGEYNFHRSANIISTLPFIKIHDPKRQLPRAKRECPICFEEYKIGDERTSLPCLHGFHRDCVNRWLASKGSCPLCKTSVS